MLIEFRVANYRSIRDEQTFSLVASKDTTLQDSHTIKTGIHAVPRLLRSAVIYGANASGKSNLIKALQYMRFVVLKSATVMQEGQTFNVQPFLLDTDYSDKPSTFEITFLLDGIRHQYGFSMNQQRIINEYLLVYKAFKPQIWFNRSYNSEKDKDEYVFSNAFRGTKELFRKTTRSNALFLSTAVQLNNDMLRPIFNWFRNQLVIFNEMERLNPKISIQMLENPDDHKNICDFLINADISLEDIYLETRKVPRKNVRFDISTEKAEVTDDNVEQKIVTFHHVAEKGNATFNMNDESSGTRNLLFMAGPILKILHQGLTFIVDELDTSLHTLLVRKLIRMFNNKDNIGNAQLIFTTHNTSFIDEPDLFRRDQIWLIDKDLDQASTVTSLLEFSPRKNEALGRGYLMGRYGAIPLLDNEKEQEI